MLLFLIINVFGAVVELVSSVLKLRLRLPSKTVAKVIGVSLLAENTFFVTFSVGSNLS